MTRCKAAAPTAATGLALWGAENNRNPITATGQTLTLGTDGKPIDKAVDPGK